MRPRTAPGPQTAEVRRRCQSFAKLLEPFNVTVLAYDKFKFGFAKGYIKEAGMEQICRYADVISFHVPLTKETMEMANAGFFTSLASRPYILNTSRGKVINLDDLTVALQENKIAGAGLDVLPKEPLAQYTDQEKEKLSLLLSLPNVIITPHIAGYTHEASYKMAETVLQKLRIG